MKKHRLTSSQFIAIGYLIVISIGTLLLSTPLASADWSWTNPLISLFTATSATCVTGLIVVDTGIYWSLFGQIIILILIQIGGIGFMAIISLISVVLKRKINLHERKIIMQSSGSIGIGGILHLIRNIAIFTGFAEVLGATLLMFKLIPLYGSKGIYYSIFLAISAFCNAGFDPLGNFQSLTSFVTSPFVNIVIMLLIVTGGLGFIVWNDLFKNKFCWKKLLLHTKMVLIASAFLIVVPAILFFLFESNSAFSSLSLGNKIIAAIFQSVTCRTAGFNTVELGSLSDGSILISVLLMMIGGSPGSTAGGMKTTTIFVLFMSIICSARRRPNIIIGKRQLDKNATKLASAVAVFYIFTAVIAWTLVLAFEANNAYYSFRDVLFEVASAIGTVGLSSAQTGLLTIGSQIVIILLMYIGRLGALSIIGIFTDGASNEDDLLKRPTEKILIG